MAEELTPKPWISRAFNFLLRNVYAGIGSLVYGVTSEVTKNVSDTIDTVTVPDEMKDPRDFLDSMMTGLLVKLKAGEIKDPFTILMFFLIYISSAMKYPLIAFNTLSEKYFAQDVRKKIKPGLLDSGSVIQAWLRGLKDAQEGGKLWDDLRKNGLSDEQIDVLKKIAVFMPSAQDLIYFGRRDIFSPSTVSFFQYDQSIPKIPEDMLKAAGLDAEKFKLFWMAHWRDIEFRTASIMLHRRIITEDEFTMMLKAANYAPGIIDKLKKISHNVFTRVDVRRMHKLGIVSEEDLVNSYMDLGYDREHAEKMRDFTIAYNADPEQTDTTAADSEKQKERDLSKTDILRLYSDGLMKKDAAASALDSLGYSPDESEYYFSRIAFQREQEKVNKYMDLYHRGYVTGVYSEEQTREFFGKLNLPDESQEHLLEMWDIEKVVKTAIPSKAELVRFFKKKIIDEFTLREELAHRKYEQKYIDWYLEDLKKEIPEGA